MSDCGDAPSELSPEEKAAALDVCLKYITSATSDSPLDLRSKKIGLIWPAPKVVEAVHSLDPLALLLDDNDLTDAMAAELIAGAQHLGDLALAHNSVGIDGVAKLTASLSKTKGLTKLDLSSNQIENDVMSALLGALKHQPLAHLNLSSNTLGSEGAAALASHIKGNPHFPLATLDLSFNGIGDDGALAILEALQKQPYSCLGELDLSYNGITVEGVGRILEVVKETLCITQLNINDDGLDSAVTDTLQQKINAHKALQPAAIQLVSCGQDTAKVLVVIEPKIMKLLSAHLECFSESAWTEAWEMKSKGGCMPSGRCEFQCQINGLRPNVRYAVRLRVRYVSGGSCSPILTFSTLPQPSSPKA